MDKKDKDNKATEEKALNYFRAFIEDSRVISQYLDEDDKEPCWDGHLYLYSDGIRDKKHQIGRVPVQIKGTEVKSIITNGWKFSLDKDDLKAYLHEPTFYIVCQIKENSKERKLFYRELLPNLVNTLLRDMGKQQSRKTLFHPLTEDLKEFEDQLKVFMSNSTRMVSFADKKPLSMADAVKKGIKEFSFVTPSRFSDLKGLLKYLSTHYTYLYAKVSEEFDIDMPLSDGPARFDFKHQDDGDIKIGDRIFYKGYTSEVKAGRFVTTIADVITIDMPMDKTDPVKPTLKMKANARYLKDAIKETEFAIALNDVGVLRVGDIDLQLAANENLDIDCLRKRLERWKALDSVLDRMHVEKPFDLENISDEQNRQIDLLIDTIGKGNTIKIPGQQTTLLTMDIGNVKLLLWCAAESDGVCVLGDFFDKTVKISYKVNDNDTIKVSPFSYLRNEQFWQKLDNIDYESIIDSAKEAVKDSEYCYAMSNLDVLAMIDAADAVSESDVARSKKLLEEALKLDEWLEENDSRSDMSSVHFVNKMQILKRQRELSEEEKNELKQRLQNKELADSVRVAINLLLDKKSKAMAIFDTLTEDEKIRLKEFPIWKFANIEK